VIENETKNKKTYDKTKNKTKQQKTIRDSVTSYDTRQVTKCTAYSTNLGHQTKTKFAVKFIIRAVHVLLIYTVERHIAERLALTILRLQMIRF